MADKDPRAIDRAAEEARQRRVIDAVAARNAAISAGANPDPNVGTGFYPGDPVKKGGK